MMRTQVCVLVLAFAGIASLFGDTRGWAEEGRPEFMPAAAEVEVSVPDPEPTIAADTDTALADEAECRLTCPVVGIRR